MNFGFIFRGTDKRGRRNKIKIFDPDEINSVLNSVIKKIRIGQKIF